MLDAEKGAGKLQWLTDSAETGMFFAAYASLEAECRGVLTRNQALLGLSGWDQPRQSKNTIKPQNG
jgi:hypothetical protein